MNTRIEILQNMMDKLDSQSDNRYDKGDFTQFFRSVWELSGTFNDLNPCHDRLCYGVFWKNSELHYDFYDNWDEALVGMVKRLQDDEVSHYSLLTSTIWKTLWNEYEFFQFLALMAVDEKECESYVDKAAEIACYMLHLA